MAEIKYLKQLQRRLFQRRVHQRPATRRRSTLRRLSEMLEVRALLSMVGVDFDATDNRPANWNTGNWDFALTDTLEMNSLVDETGVPSPIDLRVVSSTFANDATGTVAAGGVPVASGTLPTHSPPLDNLSGTLFVLGETGVDTITATWQNLTPGATDDQCRRWNRWHDRQRRWLSHLQHRRWRRHQPSRHEDQRRHADRRRC